MVFQYYHCRFQCSPSLEKLRRHYHIDLPKRYMRVLDKHYGTGWKRSKKNLEKLNECSYCGNLFDKSRLDSHACNRQIKLGGVPFDPSYYGHNEDETLKAPSRNPRDKQKLKSKSKPKPPRPQSQS